MAENKITKHELVPSHEKISGEEKERLLSSMDINFKDLPKMFTDDPALEGLDAKHGDIIKVKRKSSTAGNTVFYRGVVNA